MYWIVLLFLAYIAYILYKPGNNVTNDANENKIISEIPDSSRVSIYGTEPQKQIKCDIGFTAYSKC